MTQQNFGMTQHNFGMTQQNFGMTQQNLGMSQQSFGTTQPNLHMNQHYTMPTQQMDDGRHGSVTTGSRRALFPHNGPINDHGDSPDRLQVTKAPHEISVTYDSFTDRLQCTSCKSTPAKSAPASPSSADHDIELTLNDSDKKGLGFTIIQEKSPATEIAKKKEKFLLSRLKKEEEMRKKQIEREAELESKKREARAREEAAQQKKTEERMKRDQRLREFQLRKKLEEEAANPNPGVIGGSSGRKPTNKSKTYHIPTEQATSIQNLLDLDSPTNYAVADLNSAKPSTHPNGDHDGEDTGSNGSGGSSKYKGPKLFKKLSSKSNRALIHNALSHCCLPGKVNESARLKILQELEQSEARHLMVLFRDNKCQYRALYSYNPETEKLTKINGTGPHTISAYMILSLFKYNSGRRAFTCVPSKTLSVSIDAITIKQSLWQKR
uniref:CKK domain-containing protein n=1 Tax=Ciona savignyi TaxID=51511 RepID=H2YGU2_CIOSA